MSILRNLLVLLYLCAPLFAGQSRVLTGSNTASNSSVAAQSANGACRVEFMLHDVDSSPTTNHGSIASGNACGLNFQWLNLSASDIRIQLYNERESGGSVCQILGTEDHLTAGFYVRWQHIPSGAGGTDTCQAWDIDGVQFYPAAGGCDSRPYTSTSGSNSNGFTLTGAGTGKAVSWGFFKVYTTTVSCTARPPVHGTNGSLLSWKFDGDATDESGNSYTATLSGGSYDTDTPGQDLVVAVVKTNPAPTWTDRRTLRVGVATPLDLTESYSQADDDASVSCDVTLDAVDPMGIDAAISDETDNCEPTITPDGFGDYALAVHLTAANMVTHDETIHVGAVEMDANGVVTLSADAAKIFGPMIALGWNPWGRADERAAYAAGQRRAVYDAAKATAPSYSLGNPEWDTAQTGTVSYTWNGKGNSNGASCTTITEDLTTSELDIDVANASCLNLSSLPTRIVIQATNGSFAFEEVRICSATGTTGAQTLTVCYDGRGKNDYLGCDGGDCGHTLGPTAWSSGAVVGQNLVLGSGTSFLSTLAPAGAGPIGPIHYSSGTASVTANSATFEGSGTTWTTGAAVGYIMRIEATHSTGTPFVFVGYIQSITDNDTLVLNRVFPADADTASGLTYQIIRPFYRRIVTSFTRQSPFAGSAWINWGGTSCESDTQCFFNPAIQGHDIAAYNGDSYSGESYTFEDWDNQVINISSTGGVNFYGEDLAHYALWLRSGLAEHRTTAQRLAHHWIRYPGMRGQVSGYVYSPLFIGGGSVGAVACLIVDPDCALSWDDIRPLAYFANNYATTGSCEDGDSRDTGYQGILLALLANFDPDDSMGGWLEMWKAGLQDLYTLEDGCKGADNSWAVGTPYTNFNGKHDVTVETGSTAGTGTGFDSAMCYGRASGTFSITGNTLTATGGTFSSNSAYTNIVLNDASGNRAFTQFLYTDSTHGDLSAVWHGDSTGTWLQTEGFTEDWGMSVYENNLTKNYECTYVNSTTITLERPWEGTNGTYALMPSFVHGIGVAGKGQQPYMIGGIKSYAFVLAANLDGELSTDFSNLAELAGTWAANTGFDTNNNGMHYARVFQSCEPAAADTGTDLVATRPGCSYTNQIDSAHAARMLIGESARAFTLNTTDTITRGDLAYNSLWCDPALNDSSISEFECDANAPALSTTTLATTNISDGSFQGGKWTGFFAGMGMLHQWPAFRQASPPPVPAAPRSTIRGSVVIRGSAGVR